MDPADLDAFAAALRERLLAGAGDDAPLDLEGRIRALVEREAALLDAGAREALVARVAERSFGLGPLEPLLRDPAVDEVMVNGAGPVWVERAGRLEPTAVRFATAGALREVIERILAPLGRRVDEAEPLCDARLPDRIRASRRWPDRGARGCVIALHGVQQRPVFDDRSGSSSNDAGSS
jgi:pilus assembly protein CpaF